MPRLLLLITVVRLSVCTGNQIQGRIILPLIIRLSFCDHLPPTVSSSSLSTQTRSLFTSSSALQQMSSFRSLATPIATPSPSLLVSPQGLLLSFLSEAEDGVKAATLLPLGEELDDHTIVEVVLQFDIHFQLLCNGTPVSF